MRLSLLLTGGDDPRLLLETARRAEELGLAALWLPERHGTGAGLFPNPASAAAALAVATCRIALRAAPLPSPLHNPIRVAEEWALVDNLSGGRAGLAFAAPAVASELETVRRLWRGEAVRTPDGAGRPLDLRILPHPLQPELPLWLADPRSAAALGADLFLAAPDGGALQEYRAAGGAGEVAVAVDPGLLEDLDGLGAGEATEIAVRTGLAGARSVLDRLEARRGR